MGHVSMGAVTATESAAAASSKRDGLARSRTNILSLKKERAVNQRKGSRLVVFLTPEGERAPPNEEEREAVVERGFRRSGLCESYYRSLLS